MKDKIKNLGMTFQYEENGRCETLGERQSVQDRINKPWTIRLESRRQDTHPDIDGGKPFFIARYTQNTTVDETPSPEHYFELFSTLIKETALFIIVVSKDGKERKQYSKDELENGYKKYVEEPQDRKEVEQLISEV